MDNELDIYPFIKTYQQYNKSKESRTDCFIKLCGILIAHITMQQTLKQTQEALDGYVLEMIRTGESKP